MDKQKKSNKQYGIKEIAKRANVSIATVDRVIHNRTGVAQKTKEKIQKIIKEIDYQPNLLASRLKSNKEFVLAVLIPKVSENTNFWEAPYNGILKAKEEIEKYGVIFKTFLFELSNKDSFMESAIALLDENVDGILMAPSFVKEAEQVVKIYEKEKIPYLFIDSNIAANGSITYIGPNLYHSGFVGAQLTKYVLHNEKDEILVTNISKTDTNIDNLKQIEKGFSDYITTNKIHNRLQSIAIKDGDYNQFKTELDSFLEINPNIKSIFVTNSRVFSIARYLKETNRRNITLIGFDFIAENVKYLKEGVIDFLICHKPEEQGYRGIMSLYHHLILMQKVEKTQFMPIDIVTKENCDFYPN
ncbi:LacI family DNA-binding transcriptional regulator [Membranihabitans maritimus]|uniref:substrate-binding domain-containing protein n=1 Tax=Membranihabitans maritimus TaxID=2904244 RepID=UPI001F307F00|nr:LacI family DNA-binding transcriptional regulator [Membranihabitans maritimus]